MIAKIKLLSTTLLAAFVIAFALPNAAFANIPADPGGGGGGGGGACPQRVFTFPTWYKGVVNTGTCEINIDSISDFVIIPLNFLDMLIQAVAYAAVGYIVWGGFKYMKSQGDPSKITEAKGAIINALTGLGIALASVAIVEFIQGRII